MSTSRMRDPVVIKYDTNTILIIYDCPAVAAEMHNLNYPTEEDLY